MHLSEAFGWKEGLSRKFGEARGFYGVIIVSTAVGLSLNFVGIDPIKALVFTAVFNGDRGRAAAVSAGEDQQQRRSAGRTCRGSAIAGVRLADLWCDGALRGGLALHHGVQALTDNPVIVYLM